MVEAAKRYGANYKWKRRLYLYLRDQLLQLINAYYNRVYGMDLHPTSRFSLKANLDKTNPKGVHLGAYSYVAFGAVVLTHDMCRKFHADTYIGENCFIGAHALIMPGVRIGDQCIIGAGSVVVRDVPSNCIVAGNPAKIVKENIATKHYGMLID